jgi:hypothetical protein
MKQAMYCKHFKTKNSAIMRATIKNQACKAAGNYSDIFCVVPGPDCFHSVVDLKTAIELGSGYFIPN